MTTERGVTTCNCWHSCLSVNIRCSLLVKSYPHLCIQTSVGKHVHMQVQATAKDTSHGRPSQPRHTSHPIDMCIDMCTAMCIDMFMCAHVHVAGSVHAGASTFALHVAPSRPKDGFGPMGVYVSLSRPIMSSSRSTDADVSWISRFASNFA